MFTTVTALPEGITRATVLETLHNHVEMIDLNPLVTERHPIKPPPEASAEEYHCQWYAVTDKVKYLPGGLYSGSVTFNGCFHDLPNGLQTHIYAPLGLNMKGRWTLGGSLPGEPREAVELGLGVPKTGLWLREDVDMKCNVVMTSFVKKTTKKAHTTLVQRLVEKAHLMEAQVHNTNLSKQSSLRNSNAAASSIYSDTQSDEQQKQRQSYQVHSAQQPVEQQQHHFYQPYSVQQPLGYQQERKYSYGQKSQQQQPAGTGGHEYLTGPTVYPNKLAAELPSQQLNEPLELDGSQEFSGKPLFQR